MYFASLLTVVLFFLCASARMEPGTIRRAPAEVLEYARQNEWSNAQRLARGLPPIGPKFRRTPTQSMSLQARASPSSMPNSSFTGHFGVRSSNGSFIGVLSGTGSAVGGLVQQGDPTQLNVQLLTSKTSSGPAALAVTNVSPQYDIGGQGSPTLAVSTPAYAALGAVTSGPGVMIWTINPTTRDLTAQWTNSDGSTPSTIIVYSRQQNQLYITSDVSALSAAVPGGVVPVRTFISG